MRTPCCAPISEAAMRADSLTVSHRVVCSDAYASPPAPAVLDLRMFGIPLGLTALAGTWRAANSIIAVPDVIAYMLSGTAAAMWTVFTIMYGWQQLRRHRRFVADLKHPVSGPSTAYIPVIGILLTSQLGAFLPHDVDIWLCWLFVAGLAVTAARLLAHWLSGELTIDVLHPGYFLPVVAGPFVASVGLSNIAAHYSALAAFGVGMFFWLIIGALVIGRLVDRGPLPVAARPLLSVLLSAPATGGIAWSVLNGGKADAMAAGFLGIIVVLLLMQIALGGHYRPLQMDLGLWTFTFPAASSSTFAIQWLNATQSTGSVTWAWLILATATLILLAVATGTLAALTTRHKRSPQRSLRRRRHKPGSGSPRLPRGHAGCDGHSV